MSERCLSCGEKLEFNEMGKLIGTIVKVKKGDKNELAYFCRDCQKEGKDTA